jgi:hypothetical protein
MFASVIAGLLKATCALSLSASMGVLTGGTVGSAKAASFGTDAACQGTACQAHRGTDSGQPAEALPPDAKPGECYARVYVPPEYKTVTEPVKARGAYEEIEVTPAQYELAVKLPPLRQARLIGFLAKPADVGKVGVPGEDLTTRSQKLPSPPTTRTVYVTTAEYTEVQRTIKVRDGKTIWKRVNCKDNEGVATEAPEAEPQASPPATDATPSVRV